jgi:putative polyhydroxyalkanoate system protein
MADIQKTKSHKLELPELRTRLGQLADEMSKKFGIKCQWDGDVCRLSGNPIKSGSLTMNKSDVTIELTLGLVAKMLKGQIEKEIESRMNKILS